MKAVYVAHPLRGDVAENTARITKIIRQLVSKNHDILPLSPIHNFGFLDPATYDAVHGMQLCFALLNRAEELWVFGEWWQSEGCQAEICYAGCRGIPIRFKGLGA